MHCWKKLPGFRESQARRRCLALLALLCLPLAAPASDVDVRLAYARATDGAWLVTTRIDFELDAEAEQQVRDGLRLRVEVEFEVAEARALLPAKKLASVVRTLYLQFDAESARFVVSSPSANARAEFATMFSALRKLGYLTDQPVIDAQQLEPGETYAFSVKVGVFPDDSGWWRRNVSGRLGLGLVLRSQTYTWSLTP